MRLLMLGVMIFTLSIQAQNVPVYQNFTSNKPNLNEKNEVYLGDKMLEQAEGSYKACVIPKETKLANKRMYTIEYRANEPMCKMSQNDKDYQPMYDNYRDSGNSNRFPIRISTKGNTVTVKYCQMGLCAGKVKFDKSMIEVSDKTFVYAPNSFQQSIEYAGKSGNKLNFTYTEFKSGMSRDAFTRNFQIDLDEGDVAAFKGAIIKIHSATNISIVYEVLRNFQS